MTSNENLDTSSLDSVRELYTSLDQRWRPESVAQRLVKLLDTQKREKRILNRAANSVGRGYWFTSMSQDFHRPPTMERQLRTAQEIFGIPVNLNPADVDQINQWILEADQSIGKTFGKNDFKADRLSKPARTELGLELSRRQYNKRFRLAARLEKKAKKLAREQFKRSITLASKNQLASEITWDDFSSDVNTACFISYYVARANLRSIFTNTSQARAYDEICDMLMKRCQQSPDQTNWWAICHAWPQRTAIQFLNDDQKGRLLGAYFNRLHQLALYLEEVWHANTFRDNMIVQRGNDSSSWNIAAGAWNKLRAGWFQLLYALNLQDGLEKVCPGKVLRLMAADVAAWHRSSGGDVHPDTKVWMELPRPWSVLEKHVDCSKELVELTCRRHGLDPVKSGWVAPPPDFKVEKFAPTPELVHGVAVGSPTLASMFRRAGVFSGKVVKGDFPADLVAVARDQHRDQQEKRRLENEENQRRS